MAQAAVQKAVVGNIFTIGASGLISVALAGFFGRTLVTILFQAAYFATTVWSGLATSCNSYLASRVLSGLLSSAGQGGALFWIKDMVRVIFLLAIDESS